MRRRLEVGLAVIVTAAGLAGCGHATRLAQVWKGPAASTAALHNVTAVFVDHNTPHRRAIERDLAGRFANTTPSYNDVDEPSADGDGLVQQLRASAYDGAIVMRIASVKTENRWVGGMNYTTPRYQVTDTTVTVDTRVYSLPDGKLLFSARSETVNPGSDARLTASVMRHVTAELRQDGLLQLK